MNKTQMTELTAQRMDDMGRSLLDATRTLRFAQEEGLDEETVRFIVRSISSIAGEIRALASNIEAFDARSEALTEDSFRRRGYARDMAKRAWEWFQSATKTPTV